MKKIYFILGLLVSLFGLSIMVTPLRTYFIIIGWMIGSLLLLVGVPTLLTGIFKKQRSISRILVGAIPTVIGFLLVSTDLQQTLTQNLVIFFIAGGIVLTGLSECIIGCVLFKQQKKGFLTILVGLISVGVGLASMYYSDASAFVLGLVVGYHILRMGISLLMLAKDYDKPHILEFYNEPSMEQINLDNVIDI